MSYKFTIPQNSKSLVSLLSSIKPPFPNLAHRLTFFAPKLHLIGVNWHPNDKLLDHFPLSKSELKQEAADLLFTDSDSDTEFKGFSESEMVIAKQCFPQTLY